MTVNELDKHMQHAYQIAIADAYDKGYNHGQWDETKHDGLIRGFFLGLTIGILVTYLIQILS